MVDRRERVSAYRNIPGPSRRVARSPAIGTQRLAIANVRFYPLGRSRR